MLNVDYNGNNNMYVRYDGGETEQMKANIIDCFQTICSWSKDGEEINFHINKTNEEEINKLRKHIENKIDKEIINNDDNQYRVKIKTEYTARNIIKDIYHKYNQPSSYRINSITQEQVEEPIEQEETNGIKQRIFKESNEENGFDMLQNLL